MSYHRFQSPDKSFSEAPKEFQDLPFKCHSILRDVHNMDPGRAFDTISKILFVKMYVERSGRHGTFAVGFLDRRAPTRLPDDLLVAAKIAGRVKTSHRKEMGKPEPAIGGEDLVHGIHDEKDYQIFTSVPSREQHVIITFSTRNHMP